MGITRHQNSDQRIIGLTGGIGMGKSTVSSYLAKQYSIPILDADLLARDAVAPKSPILNTIVERYGPTLLHPNGSLHRAKLGEIIFGLPSERLWLDQQVHPYVRDRFTSHLADPTYQSQPIVVLAIPLLFEARMTDLVTEIWVVHCSPEQQLERLLKRSRQRSSQTEPPTPPLTPEQAQARIKAQTNISRKIELADVVLDNSGRKIELYQAIDQHLQSS